jgi:hypothetical protein
MEEEAKEVQEASGWRNGIIVGLILGIALFMLTFKLLLMAK